MVKRSICSGLFSFNMGRILFQPLTFYWLSVFFAIHANGYHLHDVMQFPCSSSREGEQAVSISTNSFVFGLEGFPRQPMSSWSALDDMWTDVGDCAALPLLSGCHKEEQETATSSSRPTSHHGRGTFYEDSSAQVQFNIYKYIITKKPKLSRLFNICCNEYFYTHIIRNCW